MKATPSGVPFEKRLVSLLLLMLSGSGTAGNGETSHGLKPSSSMKSSMALMMRFVVFWAMVISRGREAGGDLIQVPLMAYCEEGYDRKPEKISKQSKYEADSLTLRLLQTRQGDISLTLSGP